MRGLVSEFMGQYHDPILAIAQTCRPLLQHVRSRGIPEEDIRQAGWMGVVKAARNWRPEIAAEKGTTFTSYATWYIRAAVQRVAQSKSGEPGTMLSIDAWFDDGHSYSELLPAPPVDDNRMESRDWWEFVGGCLTHRQRDVIELRFKEGLPLKAVGRRIGLCGESVRLHEQHAIKRLRKYEESL